MKSKSIYLLFSMIFGFVLSSCSSNYSNNFIKKNQLDTQSEEITVSQMAEFLKTKKEHYPLSDEFIERYQQTSGGYLDNAKKAGIEVNKLKHSPNQKWHFFDSWYYPSIDDGSLSVDDSAENRIYTRLLCPELLLWIYEASEVPLNKIIEAKNVAELGKVNGTTTSSIASTMRTKVSWSDIESNVIRFLNDSKDPFKVNIESNDDVIINGLDNEYKIGTLVNFTIDVINENKIVDKVLMNDEVINKNNDGLYSFYMPGSNVTIKVILKDVIKATSISLSATSLELTKGDKNKIISATILPSDTTDIAIWSIVSGEGIISINPSGNNVYINALNEGNAKVMVTLNEDVSATFDIIVNPKINSSEVSSLYDITYDLGTSKRAKALSSAESIKDVFTFNSGEEILDSIGDFDKVYGGGNGGSGDNTWVSSNILKIGTTSYNGYLTLNLSTEVNRVVIKGFIHTDSCKIQVGDSTSSEFEGGSSPIKTTTVSCLEMTVASKTTIDNYQIGSVTVDFESTSSLKIATANTEPLYITSIEFLYVEE